MPAAAALATLEAVFANVKVVVVGTVAIVYVPLNVASTPATITDAPAEKPCAADVVSVATLFKRALLLRVKELRRISEAPPPPPTFAFAPVPPPFHPPALLAPTPPTYKYSISPGVTGIVACTRPPEPPAKLPWPIPAIPPWPPCASTCIEVTPAGTVYSIGAPEKAYVPVAGADGVAVTADESGPTTLTSLRKRRGATL